MGGGKEERKKKKEKGVGNGEWAESDADIRWQQRFSNYQRAFAQLAGAIALAQQRLLSPLEQQGLIQAFEFTQELAWLVMKDYLNYQGITAITGSRDAIRAAFRLGLVEDGEGWMDTIKSRNQAAHTYDETTANALAAVIANRYLRLFRDFNQRMQALVRHSGTEG
jgi:nucleotidyltransferase substrate binding protein (TIGR01987 family)